MNPRVSLAARGRLDSTPRWVDVQTCIITCSARHLAHHPRNMTMKTQSLFRILAALLLANAAGAPDTVLGAYILRDFSRTNYLGGSPSSLATMCTNLGINGLTIEDFRDLQIPNGILKFSGAGVIDVVPENGNSWGETGTGFLRVTNDTTRPATIEIQGGTPILGIGFSAFESGTQGSLTWMSINGGSLVPLNSTTLPSFSFSATIRNGYLVIEAGPGDPLIQRVDFVQTSGGDGYQFDYIAFASPVSPCPPSSIRVSEVEICWPSISNSVYQVDYLSDLTTNTWVPLYTNVIGDGTVICRPDRVTQPQRFYRVVCQ